MAFEDVGTATSASCTTEKCLHLEDGVKYFVTVRAWNGAGQYVETVSNGVMVDVTVPTAGMVWDGDGSVAEDLNYQSALGSLSARWSGFGDVPSGVELYRWAIGSSPGGTELFNYRVITRGATGQSAEVSLESGKTYYVSVKAVDHAGNSVVATSNGVLIDATPPKAGAITVDTLGAPDASGTVYLPSWGSLKLTWDGFEDAESELSTYEVGLGSGNCGSDDVVALHDVGRRKAWALDGRAPQCSDSADLSLTVRTLRGG